eukprot:Rhum_TRINITY_DN11687_c0_g1::Rhum_TRINITY_DN11687_c0_g1_i1::g.46156::m.46156
MKHSFFSSGATPLSIVIVGTSIAGPLLPPSRLLKVLLHIVEDLVHAKQVRRLGRLELDRPVAAARTAGLLPVLRVQILPLRPVLLVLLVVRRQQRLRVRTRLAVRVVEVRRAPAVLVEQPLVVEGVRRLRAAGRRRQPERQPLAHLPLVVGVHLDARARVLVLLLPVRVVERPPTVLAHLVAQPLLLLFLARRRPLLLQARLLLADAQRHLLQLLVLPLLAAHLDLLRQLPLLLDLSLLDPRRRLQRLRQLGHPLAVVHLRRRRALRGQTLVEGDDVRLRVLRRGDAGGHLPVHLVLLRHLARGRVQDGCRRGRRTRRCPLRLELRRLERVLLRRHHLHHAVLHTVQPARRLRGVVLEVLRVATRGGALAGPVSRGLRRDLRHEGLARGLDLVLELGLARALQVLLAVLLRDQVRVLAVHGLAVTDAVAGEGGVLDGAAAVGGHSECVALLVRTAHVEGELRPVHFGEGAAIPVVEAGRHFVGCFSFFLFSLPLLFFLLLLVLRAFFWCVTPLFFV